MDRTRLQGVIEGGYWLLLYGALWALFAGGEGWLLGIPSVALAAWVSVWLGLRPLRARLRALPAFAGFFIANMWRGAWDVAWRAVHPRGPVAPAWLDYRLHSSDPEVGLALSALVGLLPGTLASQVDGRLVRVHVLDREQDWQRTVIELERHLIALLGAEEAA